MPGPDGAFQGACAVHLERVAVQPCSRCGSFACEECLRKSPPGRSLCATCVERAYASQLPWDYREELGVGRAWIQSLGAILSRPGETFATAKLDPDVGGSLLFAGLAWFCCFFTTFAACGGFGALAPLPDIGSTSMFPFRAIMVGSYGLAMVLAPFFGLVATLAVAALDHLVMRLFGSPRSFDFTLRGTSLSLAPLILGVIPGCGAFVGLIWALVVRVFAYKELHRVPTGVAVAGALGIPGLVLVGGCGTYWLMIFIAVTTATANR